MTALLTRDVFVENLNTKFQMILDGSPPVELELVNVSEAKNYPGQDSFSIVFRAPPDAPASQSIYKLEHENIGTTELFLVPIKRDANGLYYEAVFNRLRPEAE